MNDVNLIVQGLIQCNRRCRKCKWRDPFSGLCTLKCAAAGYIKHLENYKINRIVHCKDCVYCDFDQRPWMYHGKDKYTCTNRNGLPNTPELNAFSYCSYGKAKKVVEG